MELQKQLRAAEASLAAQSGGGRLLKEEVTEEDIAEIISKWTGVSTVIECHGCYEHAFKNL